VSCDICKGSGWVIVEKVDLNGCVLASAADRCACQHYNAAADQLSQGQRPTSEEIIKGVGKLGTLRFFPASRDERVAIMEMLERMVTTKAQLDWLVTTMIDKVGEWKGPLELRGVFCTRFDPADGVTACCGQTIGFRNEDFEAVAALPKQADKQQLPAGPMREAIEAAANSRALVRR
jgi:hypothetical protein